MGSSIRWASGLIAALATLAMGCASIPQEKVAGATSDSHDLVAGQIALADAPLVVEHRGSAVLLKYSRQNEVVRSDLDGKSVGVISAGGPANAALNGLSAYSDGRRLHVAWRPKLVTEVEGLGTTGSKYIYVASSDDGKNFDAPRRVSVGAGAFPARLAGSGQGDVYAVWQDERSDKNYDLYFNVSHDEGKTWKEKDVRLDPGAAGETFSGEPSIATAGKDVWVLWKESRKGSGTMYVRHSGDAGDSWDEPVVVATDVRDGGFAPALLKGGDRLTALWYVSNGVAGAWSNDGGRKWNAMEPAKGPGQVGNLRATVDGRGVVHILYEGEDFGAFARYNLYYVRGEPGQAFSAPVRLNGGKEFESSAVQPDIAIDQAGDILVVWVDYRYFRSVIKGIMSRDGGKTWSSEAMLDAGPDSGQSRLVKAITTPAGFVVNYVRYDDALMRQGRAVAMVMKPDRPLPGHLPQVPNMATLDERVNAWWESRRQEDWSTSYDIMDPFMRERTAKKAYLNSQGTVKYFGHEIVKKEAITERRIRVTVKYTSEVPELEIYGRKIAVPKKEQTVDQDWIWIDGNWYFLFKDLLGRDFLDQ